MTEHKQESLLGLSLAKQLIEGRKAKNLSEEDVANELRLSTTVVKNIEADFYPPEKLTVFIKGYIRAYAKLVGVDLNDVDEYFASIGVLNKPPTPQPATFTYKKISSKDRSMKFTTLVVIVVLFILVLVWVEWQRSVDGSATGGTTTVATTTVPVNTTTNH